MSQNAFDPAFLDHIVLPGILGTLGGGLISVNSGSGSYVELSATAGTIIVPFLWKGTREIYEFLATNPTAQQVIKVVSKLS